MCCVGSSPRRSNRVIGSRPRTSPVCPQSLGCAGRPHSDSCRHEKRCTDGHAQRGDDDRHKIGLAVDMTSEQRTTNVGAQPSQGRYHSGRGGTEIAGEVPRGSPTISPTTRDSGLLGSSFSLVGLPALKCDGNGVSNWPQQSRSQTDRDPNRSCRPAVAGWPPVTQAAWVSILRSPTSYEHYR